MALWRERFRITSKRWLTLVISKLIDESRRDLHGRDFKMTSSHMLENADFSVEKVRAYNLKKINASHKDSFINCK